MAERRLFFTLHGDPVLIDDSDEEEGFLAQLEMDLDAEYADSDEAIDEPLDLDEDPLADPLDDLIDVTGVPIRDDIDPTDDEEDEDPEEGPLDDEMDEDADPEEGPAGGDDMEEDPAMDPIMGEEVPGDIPEEADEVPEGPIAEEEEAVEADDPPQGIDWEWELAHADDWEHPEDAMFHPDEFLGDGDFEDPAWEFPEQAEEEEDDDRSEVVDPLVDSTDEEDSDWGVGDDEMEIVDGEDSGYESDESGSADESDDESDDESERDEGEVAPEEAIPEEVAPAPVEAAAAPVVEMVPLEQLQAARDVAEGYAEALARERARSARLVSFWETADRIADSRAVRYEHLRGHSIEAFRTLSDRVGRLPGDYISRTAVLDLIDEIARDMASRR